MDLQEYIGYIYISGTWNNFKPSNEMLGLNQKKKRLIPPVTVFEKKFNNKKIIEHFLLGWNLVS